MGTIYKARLFNFHPIIYVRVLRNFLNKNPIFQKKLKNKIVDIQK